MQWKKRLLIPGIIMGCLAAGLGMIQQSRSANAAILVHDQENILQAMQTALNTATIATNAQKEVALMILDLKSMAASTLAEFIKQQTSSQQTIWNENEAKIGGLDTSRSSAAFWNENFSNVEDVLAGRIDITEGYASNQRALKAIERTNQDALHGAKTAQRINEELSRTVMDSISAASNADGTKEAIQAGTQTAAANALSTIYGNNLMADLLTVQAVKYQKEVQEEAAAVAFQEQVANQAAADVAAMKAAAGK